MSISRALSPPLPCVVGACSAFVLKRVAMSSSPSAGKRSLIRIWCCQHFLCLAFDPFSNQVCAWLPACCKGYCSSRRLLSPFYITPPVTTPVSMNYRSLKSPRVPRSGQNTPQRNCPAPLATVIVRRGVGCFNYPGIFWPSRRASLFSRRRDVKSSTTDPAGAAWAVPASPHDDDRASRLWKMNGGGDARRGKMERGNGGKKGGYREGMVSEWGRLKMKDEESER